PAQNARPSPARSTARASPAPWKAAVRSATRPASSAFRRSGRASVTRSTGPSRSTRTVVTAAEPTAPPRLGPADAPVCPRDPPPPQAGRHGGDARTCRPLDLALGRARLAPARRRPPCLRRVLRQGPATGGRHDGAAPGRRLRLLRGSRAPRRPGLLPRHAERL